MTDRARTTLLALALVALPAATVGAAAQGPPLGTPIPERPLGEALEEDAGPRAFLANQLTFDRVVRARDATQDSLRALFREKGVSYATPQLYLRVLKHERILELWARDHQNSPFTLIKEYPVCALPGQLGPKQRMGDFQVPEGFYFIDEFNPRSSYHLSLRVSYPNMADRMRREAVELGGDIFVHGGCETVGCVPIENENIQEVYWLAARAMDAGQRIIPIHIFPSRMDPATMRWLQRTFQPEGRLLDFWRNLAEGYTYFEETRRVPWITVAADGRYHVPATELLAGDAPGDDGGPAGPPADSTRPDSAGAGPVTPDSAAATAGDDASAGEGQAP